ncbi:Gamma-glutamyltranspeptidase [Candidatus Promineifilum breve]|uniref:Gamma-glutamyltranspeptidase n=1 Tax=Candidatus Promineifilum breve TaxID=1806508 RepID=A0A160T423_9CHLR|nr:gamma-glutamyltransferase [Candidatus Promineifilum breve]CUS04099.2 Gamma-glutamyltranspeptidase [Candidatus Promineifilum breve]
MTKGVIAAGDRETAAAGAEMLRAGGNAVDAAVAAAFVSFLAEAGIVHLGGSGLAQLYDARSGLSRVYDFFSVVPGLGGPVPETIDFEKVTIDFGAATQSFYLGRGSVAVPGNIAGLCRLAADYGRLPLGVLLEPALRLARDGVALVAFQTDTCRLLAPLYTHTDDIRRVFAPQGRLIQPEERLFIPDLAHTLAALAREGDSYARRGPLAQALLSDQAANGGLLTATDLEQYEVLRPAPIRVAYRGYEVLLPPLCSAGGVLTAFTLKLLAAFDVAAQPHGSAAHLQLLAEAMAATTRARAVWDDLLDTLPGDEATARFLDDGFIAPYRDEMRAALAARRPSPIVTEPPGPTNTSHLSVIDGDGLCVGLTTTAGESAGYIVPGTGYIPNNMLGEEDLHPKGFHSRPAGQRIPTMMAPVVVLERGQPRLVVGSGGSIRIRSAILQTLSNLLDYRLPLDKAVNLARVHLDGEVLQCEAGYDARAVDELESLGYRVNRWPTRGIYFGGAHSVARDADGRLYAAGDNRRGGATAEE